MAFICSRTAARRLCIPFISAVISDGKMLSCAALSAICVWVWLRVSNMAFALAVSLLKRSIPLASKTSGPV